MGNGADCLATTRARHNVEDTMAAALSDPPASAIHLLLLSDLLTDAGSDSALPVSTSVTLALQFMDGNFSKVFFFKLDISMVRVRNSCQPWSTGRTGRVRIRLRILP